MNVSGMRWAILVAAGAAMIACGDEGSQPSSNVRRATTVAPQPANNAPTISGSPAPAIVEGQVYLFKPAASDPDGNPLTFSISGKPAWAAFNASTGQLSGTPGAGSVGTYGGIRIVVSDGSSQAALGEFTITVQQTGDGAATLSWLPPTSRTDGSPLTNLAGYKIRWGHAAGMYPNTISITNPGLTAYVIDNLAPGAYYFVLASFDTGGVESADTNPVSKTTSQLNAR